MYALKVLLRKSADTKTLATIFHDEGNNFFNQRKYFEALKSYNKSLCHAKPNSVDLIKSFAGRSAVYFEMQHYQKCVENIRLARLQPKYVTDKKLDDREFRCNEIMKLGNTTDSDMFKLSYISHQKIPYIASCIELSEDDKYGRYIRSNCHLRPGDIIAIEKPFLKFTDLLAMNIFKYQRCFNCFKANKLSLLPGPHSGNSSKLSFFT